VSKVQPKALRVGIITFVSCLAFGLVLRWAFHDQDFIGVIVLAVLFGLNGYRLTRINREDAA